MENYEKYSDKGLSGLANAGNTCYLNSCLQILSHTYEINELLDSDYKKKLNKKPESIVLLEWDKLNKMLWKNNCIIAPYGFLNTIRKISILKDKILFAGSEQNDISEFLYFLIDCFHNALAREVDMKITGSIGNETDKIAEKCYKMIIDQYTKDWSEFLDLFYGISVSKIINTKENIISATPEPFSVLSLPIPQHKGNEVSLYECLDEYCIMEEMKDENAWYNEDTGFYENVKKNIQFWSLPDILIIDIKRWKQNGNKNHILVNAPIENADFSKYIIGYNKNKYIYDLYGICNHSGGSLGGHYTATIKNANDKWYEINDTIVKENNDKLCSAKSYCFFYRKKKHS